MFRVVLQDGQDEHKSLEIFKAQHSVDCEMSAWTARELAMSGKMVSDRGELEWIGRGVNSRIAFWTMVRFAQERAHSRKARFPVTQSSRPLTGHRSALAGSRVSRNEG